ncbi:MAG: L,D-transpeptidase [Parvibaculaceae bacterium]
MTRYITRRSFFGRTFVTGVGLALGAGAGLAQDAGMDTTDGTVDPFPIPQVNLKKIPREFHRQTVEYMGHEWPGTIVVDTKNRFLFKILPGQQAIRYGVGVGREGFSWSGDAEVGAKQMWPTWNPPKEMVARDPNAAKWANGQPGGPDNPLGARALYLYQGGRDTLFRIHGTNAPKSIGKAMSSGCIRMLNQDVVELYRMTPIGTRVTVLPADPQQIFEEDEIAGAGAPDDIIQQ